MGEEATILSPNDDLTSLQPSRKRQLCAHNRAPEMVHHNCDLAHLKPVMKAQIKGFFKITDGKLGEVSQSTKHFWRFTAKQRCGGGDLDYLSMF